MRHSRSAPCRFLSACAAGVSWGWQAATDVARGRDPRERYRVSRPAYALESVAREPVLAWVDGPACAVAHGIPTGEESPLLAEMTAIRLHTVQLHHLAAQEEQRDIYQHLARIQIRHLLTAWQHQTAGVGTLADLLPRGTSAPHRSPAPVAARSGQPNARHQGGETPGTRAEKGRAA